MFGDFGENIDLSQISRNQTFPFGLGCLEQTLSEVVGVAGFHSKLEERWNEVIILHSSEGQQKWGYILKVVRWLDKA